MLAAHHELRLQLGDAHGGAPGHARQQVLGRRRADLGGGQAQRGQRRPQEGGVVGVVEPHHRELARHVHAAGVRLDHGAEGELVGAAQHRGGPLPAGGEDLAQRVAAVADAVGDLHVVLRPDRERAGGQGAHHALHPGAAAVVLPPLPGDDAEAAMPEVQQVLGGARGGGGVVEAHAAAVARQAEGLHQRDAAPLDATQQRRAVDVAHQHQPVDAALQQEARLQQLPVQVVAGAGHHQRVVVPAQALLEGGQRAQEALVLEVGHHRAHRHEAAGGQRARGAVGHEAQRRRRPHHRVVLVRPDGHGAVQHARDGGGRHARAQGHVARRREAPGTSRPESSVVTMGSSPTPVPSPCRPETC